MTADRPGTEPKRRVAERPAVLERLDALVGEWRSEVTHPLLPGITAQGRAVFEWLEDGGILRMHSTVDHPDFPDGVMLIGCDDTIEACTALYYDSRGVARTYQVDMRDGVLSYWRDAPGFSQRFTGTLAADGTRFTGQGELSRDGTQWEPDVAVTYTRLG